MPQSTPATERVAFQHGSALAKKLTDLCQAFLDWADATRTLRLVDGKLPPITQARLRAAVDYARTTFGPAVSRLVHDEVRLNTKVLYFSDPVANFFMIYMARDFDGEETRIGTDLLSGTRGPGTTPVDLTLFDKLDVDVDLARSRFTTPPSGYLMMLGIFPAVFLGEEVFSGVEPFTARELAAAILHEIGHAVGFAEHITDLYHRADEAGNSVRYLNERADDKTLTATMNSAAASTHRPPDANWTEWFDSTKSEIEATRARTSGVRPVLVATCVLYLFWKTFLAALHRMIVAGWFGRINDSARKSSDTVVTQSNAGYFERIADEFVSRHGLGAELVSCLVKMHTFDTIGHIRSSLDEALRNHKTIRAIITTWSAVSAFFGMLLYVDDGTYDPEWLRFEHVLRNNLVVFKDTSLSPELRDYYLKQTADLIAQIKSYTGTNRHKISQLFWGTIMRITSRGSVLDAFHTAGLSADYDILQRLTGGLIKNPLYYQAARLKKLSGP